MKNKFNILVTGVGSIIGYGIIKDLRSFKHNLNIVGMDIFHDAYGRYLADEFILAKKASSKAYPDFINLIIKNHKIDLIIPGIVQDLYRLHGLNKNGLVKTKIVLNNNISIRMAKDKLFTHQFLSKFSISLIPTLSNSTYKKSESLLGTPFLIKPVNSYSSKGIEIIKNKEDFNFFTNKLKNQCIYQKIVGDPENEFTVSLFGDGKGSFYDYIILKRKLSQEGSTSKAELIPENTPLLNYIRQIVDVVKPSGPTNLQAMKHKNKYLLLEINPRISSASSIRSAMGYNEPVMCIQYYLQNTIPVARKKKSAKAVRFIKDYILYE